MYGHREDAEAWPERHQGTAGALRAESALCSPRYDEDRREHVKTVEWVVRRRSREGESERKRYQPAGGTADRLAGEGPAAAGGVRAGEPAVAPDRGGIPVFSFSSSHQPPRQVNGVVRKRGDPRVWQVSDELL